MYLCIRVFTVYTYYTNIKKLSMQREALIISWPLSLFTQKVLSCRRLQVQQSNMSTFSLCS